MAIAYLSLGSNIDREKNITSCLQQLSRTFQQLEISPVYESESVGFEGTHFYNLVVSIETHLELNELAACLKAMEDRHGRDRSGPKFGSRTLDIDIVSYDDLVGLCGGIELPRPELYYNAFVLLPMASLVPDHIDPKTQQSYQALWQSLDTDQKLWEVPFSWA